MTATRGPEGPERLSKMEGMGNKERRPTRSFTDEFKAEVVALCKRGDRTMAAVSRDLDLTESCVKRWVAQAAVDAGERPGLTTSVGRSSSPLKSEDPDHYQDFWVEAKGLEPSNLLTASQALYQLSYAPRRWIQPSSASEMVEPPGRDRAARRELQRPAARRRCREARSGSGDVGGEVWGFLVRS